MTDSAAAAYLAHARRLQRLRRIIALATIPLLLAALALAAKLLSLYPFAHSSISAYLAGDGASTTRSAGWLKPINWFESWKAPFNAGDGYALNGQLPEARASFEESLSLANGIEQCTVRVNLAIVIGRQGDEAGGTTAEAKQLYDEALDVLAEMPQECASGKAQDKSSDPDRNPQEQANDQRRELQEKQNQQGGEEEDPDQDPDEGDGDPDESDSPDQDKLDQIKEKLEQGQQERNDRDQRQGDQGGSGGGTDRPW